LVIFLSPGIYKKYISIESEELRRVQKDSSLPSASASAEMVGAGPVKIDKSFLTKSFSLANLPKRVIIPSLSLDLPVKPAKLVDGTWELSEDSASFGLGSATPGSSGNTVIFAHAKAKLFRPLRGIKECAEVYILTSQKWYSYKVTKIKTVLPSQIEVIEPTDNDTLTLFTCSGFADAKRLIVVAERSSN